MCRYLLYITTNQTKYYNLANSYMAQNEFYAYFLEFPVFPDPVAFNEYHWYNSPYFHARTHIIAAISTLQSSIILYKILPAAYIDQDIFSLVYYSLYPDTEHNIYEHYNYYVNSPHNEFVELSRKEFTLMNRHKFDENTFKREFYRGETDISGVMAYIVLLAMTIDTSISITMHAFMYFNC